ncbi:nuclear egress membrane protein [pteropodid alphaherpesvirus 2]|uniref:Nuclear egress membrane protein n=1 Tax=pteropodid alphaherpesvirus 2 TaxID=3118716 RepID=A0A510J6Y0_9ALPH|nr:nuclear egress membrane protein [pteropodid alphaherpesvirus 2]BBM13206.1 nuclear egress membrane protein [pteropodid alphaherpesvirus 2]
MGRPKSCGGRREDLFESLIQRIRLVVPASLCSWECDSGPYSPANPPSRCAFQFNGQNGSDDTFPIEYVLRLMSDWAEAACDPYLRIQNTGVSVLFQGFFNRPSDAPKRAVTAAHTNVILHSTEATGLSLVDLDDIKKRMGLDTRPMMASMWISCFVRMPRVQLAFRFMGPEDAGRTRRILCRAAEQAIERQRRSRRPSTTLPKQPAPAPEPFGAAGVPLGPQSPTLLSPPPSLAPGGRFFHRALHFAQQPCAVPPWVLFLGGVVSMATYYWLAFMR